MSSRNNNHRNNRRVKISGTIGDMPVALEIEGVNACDLYISGLAAGLLSEYVRLDTPKQRAAFARRAVQVADAIRSARGAR